MIFPILLTIIISVTLTICGFILFTPEDNAAGGYFNLDFRPIGCLFVLLIGGFLASIIFGLWGWFK